MWIYLCFFLEFVILADCQFYNFAHMCNNKETIDLSLGLGANALEMDLQYDSFGNPSEFRHTGLCDCVCTCPFSRTCNWLAPNSVCSSLEKTNGKACDGNSNAYKLMEYVGTKEQVAAIILDCKVNDQKKPFTPKQLDYAAKQTMEMLDKMLFSNPNSKAKVIVETHRKEFLSSFTKVISKNNHRVFFTVAIKSMNELRKNWKELQKLENHQRYIYSIGETSCNPFTSIDEKVSTLVAINKARGVFGLTYAWTFNKRSSLKRLVNFFNGIITNYPGKLAKILKEQGIRLATPDDEIPLQTSENFITSTEGYQCDCSSKKISFFKRGCEISKPAPQNLACQCKKFLSWCSGKVVLCRDPDYKECKQPTTSFISCQQGRGDCTGY